MHLNLAKKPRELTPSAQSQTRDELLMKNQAGAFNFPEPQSIFRKIKEKIKNKIKENFNNILYYALGTATAVVFLALTLTAFPKKAEAKPPPFYNKSSVFSYAMFTPHIEGMKGEGPFFVGELGGTYQLPPQIRVGGTTTRLTLMALIGETKCNTVPESKFAKFAITSNTTIGDYTISVGVRPILASIGDFDFLVGRGRKIHIDGKSVWDGDIGVKIKREPFEVSATRFNMYQKTMDGKWVFSGTLSVPIGYASLFGDTESDNVGLGVGKMIVRNRGKNRYGFEVGYELGPKSTYGCLVVGLGRTTGVFMAQSDDGKETSFHALMSLSLAGKEKEKGHGK